MSQLNKMQLLVFFVSGLSLATISGFNISPRPNLIFREPDLGFFINKTKSSYFGFSLNLREKSIIVGAPRAQSNLEAQRKVNETGAIYKCSLKTGECAPFVFDTVGNIHFERAEYTYDSEKKDMQWLGAAIDGGSKDSDKLVVCAPRLYVDSRSEYLAHGICYWTPDTLGNEPRSVKKISPLRLKTEQLKVVNRGRVYNYAYAEMGMSVHITENNEEIIIGAPGIYNWKGSIIRYRPKPEEDIGGLSRRSNPSTSDHRISSRQAIDFVSEIPDPSSWSQQNDSYFGYAVTSGYFDSREPHRIIYVASAPQANSQSGEVYMFNMVNSIVMIHFTFAGRQFGEYFGYTLLSEDFNGDGLIDLAISAPFYSTGGSYENGAVYIFLNTGELNFKLNQVLTTANNLPGRFGTTLSKLGDIDHDGYNDIAIGAPFEENGAVYIFLGSANGLYDKPSQILRSPIDQVKTQSMFGHGISKGVDIDFNGHNELAIGAPNSETVYLYKTYPVVKINAFTQSLSRSINIDQTGFQIRACWQLDSTSDRTNQQPLKITLKVDPKVKRVFFVDNINEREFEVMAGQLSVCKVFDVTVKFVLAEIFQPIEIEIHYDLINKIPDSEVFCEKCAAINPRDAKYSTEKIAFSTGCKSDICVSDLQLKSSGFGSSYILGSSRTKVVTYSIRNAGETSYLTQLNITTSSQMPFAKIPTSCNLVENTMLCQMFKGRPMVYENEDSLEITFDTTKLDGNSVTIRAEAFSTGNELKSSDNVIVNEVQLVEYTEIDISHRELTPILNLENDLGTKEIKNIIEIRNNGPSTIKHMNVLLYIPVSYLVPKTQNRILLVEYNNITLNATHQNKLIKAVFSQNNTIIIQNPTEITSTQSPIVDNFQGMDFDSSRVGYPVEYDSGVQDNSDSDLFNSVGSRRKRSIENDDAQYDQLTQWSHTATDIRESLSNRYPINRTILFNCHNPLETLCIEAALSVSNFEPGDNVVRITIGYNVDLNQIDKILTESHDFFVITTLVDITKIGDESGKTIKIHKTYPHNIISKYKLASTPLWVYIVSIIVGLLILILMTYVFYKMGFFKREQKEELEKLHRRSQRETDDEGADQRLT